MSVLIGTMLGFLSPLAGGLLDQITAKASAAEVTIKAVAVVFVLVFIFYVVGKGGFTLGKIIMGALAGAIFLAVIFNIRFFQNAVALDVTGGVIAMPGMTSSAPLIPGLRH